MSVSEINKLHDELMRTSLILTHFVFLCCSHVFFSVESEVSSAFRRTRLNTTIDKCCSMESGLPDGASEAVLQRCGAYVKDVDLCKPGVDTGHLSHGGKIRINTNHSVLHKAAPMMLEMAYTALPYR